MSAEVMPYKISVLAFIRNARDELLLIQRRKAPNRGCWSPVGGKLEFATGESPFECAQREILEETGLELGSQALHLFGYIAEKHFEGNGHWLMFLFDCRTRLTALPPAIDEGHFQFYPRATIDQLAIPPTDRTLLWPYYDRHREGFVALRADCHPEKKLRVTVEQTLPDPASPPTATAS